MAKAIATQWLHGDYELATRWLLSGYAVAKAIATQWLHGDYELAARWLRSGYTVATR